MTTAARCLRYSGSSVAGSSPAIAAAISAAIPSRAIAASALATVPGAKAQLFVALTQSRISSEVKAGENRGVTLKHDYVVREWLGPVALDATGKARLERTVVPPKGALTNDLGVVALVQDAVTGEILQALKLDACGA